MRREGEENGASQMHVWRSGKRAEQRGQGEEEAWQERVGVGRIYDISKMEIIVSVL